MATSIGENRSGRFVPTPLFQSYPTAQPDGANPYPRVSDGAAAILQRASPAGGRPGGEREGPVDLSVNPVFDLVSKMIADPPDRKTPEAPPGVSIAANVAEAQKHRDDPLPAKLLWFYNQVHNKGPWDFKQREARNPQEKQQFENFGNYHYGVVATPPVFRNGCSIEQPGLRNSSAAIEGPTGERQRAAAPMEMIHVISSISTWGSRITRSRAASWASAAIFVATLTSCHLPVDEVRRFKGPGPVDAVIGDVETFATDGFITEVYVVPRGAKMRGEPALRVYNPGLVSARWIDAQTLLVRAAQPERVIVERDQVVVDGRRIAIEYQF